LSIITVGFSRVSSNAPSEITIGLFIVHPPPGLPPAVLVSTRRNTQTICLRNRMSVSHSAPHTRMTEISATRHTDKMAELMAQVNLSNQGFLRRKFLHLIPSLSENFTYINGLLFFQSKKSRQKPANQLI
jgi:hypothetical protein